MDSVAPRRLVTASKIGRLAAWGPGLLVMLADTDAGNVVTSAQAGATWGYRLLPLLLLLVPMLAMVQELTVRLGIATGRGFGELIRMRFGPVWAWVSLLALAVAVVGSLVTEFTGVAGVGELYGVSRDITLPIAAAGLLIVVGTGSYRRVERTALVVGLCEGAFFVVAWAAHPNLSALAHDALDLPLGNRDFLFLTAATVGAVFNPWMVFYQQSATAEKALALEHLRAARFDTIVGAVLTQGLTGAVLVAVAATHRIGSTRSGLGSIGEISEALSAVLGAGIGRAVFGFGVLSASLAAAIVCSLALAWGAGEITGYKHSLEHRPFAAGWFYGVYAACICGSAALVAFAQDLVRLNVAAQALNLVILPVVIGFLLILATTMLPGPLRLGRPYRWLVIMVCMTVIGMSVIGGVMGSAP